MKFKAFAVADAETRNAKIPQNFGLIKLQNFHGNVTSFFSTHSKITSKNFSMICRRNR